MSGGTPSFSAIHLFTAGSNRAGKGGGSEADAQFTIEDMVAEGDRVVLRLTMRGTHEGIFNGIPATGKPVVIVGTSIERIVDGRIVEGWVTNDALGILQQLGVIPGPPAP